MSSPTNSLSELTVRYFNESVGLWRRYAENLQRLTDGAILPASPDQRTGTPDLADRAREFVEVSVGHYANLLKTHADFANRLVMTALQRTPGDASQTRSTQTASRQHDRPAKAPGPAPIELTFAGVPGETASQSFAVANHKTEDLEVTFELTEFISEDGGRRFRAPVTFAPDSFVLPAGGERVVESRILIGDAFVPGSRYASMVRVPGFPHVQTMLIVIPVPARVKAAAEQTPPPERPAPSAKRRPNSRKSSAPPRRPVRRPR